LSDLYPFPARIALTVEEAMFASGVSRRALFRAMSEKRLRSSFVCGRRRINPDDLAAFMRGQPMPESPSSTMRSGGVAGRRR
jgi:hypothetical protein